MISARSSGYGSLRSVSREQQPEICTVVSQLPHKRTQAYIVHVGKGIGENTQDHRTLEPMKHAVVRMTLGTLFLEPTSTVIGHSRDCASTDQTTQNSYHVKCEMC